MFGLGGTEFGALLIVVCLIAFVVCVILIPFAVYAAQKWAYKCYKEMVEVNKKLDELIELSKPASRFFQLQLTKKTNS